jgi:hypothetical protein
MFKLVLYKKNIEIERDHSSAIYVYFVWNHDTQTQFIFKINHAKLANLSCMYTFYKKKKDSTLT